MTEQEAMALIESKIKTKDIVVFMKGTPDFPQCGFSGRVVQVFRHFGHEVEGVNVLDDDTLRSAVKVYSKWPTLPQIYVKGEFIGGHDITVEMAESGELETLLKEKIK
jgi:monothiol glutaredoxin